MSLLPSINLDDCDCTSTQARIKPKLQEVELEIEVPTKTPNYDKSKGEQICINVDGVDKYDKPDHQNFFEGFVL